jgi:hypothetical protein
MPSQAHDNPNFLNPRTPILAGKNGCSEGKAKSLAIQTPLPASLNNRYDCSNPVGRSKPIILPGKSMYFANLTQHRKWNEFCGANILRSWPQVHTI